MDEVPDEELQVRPQEDDLICAYLSDERLTSVLEEMGEEEDDWPFDNPPAVKLQASLARLAGRYNTTLERMMIALAIKACDDLDALVEDDRADLKEQFKTN